MARVRKPQPTLDALFFSTPEQKVIRFLLSEPTTQFTPRVISSKLKGIRGLGGAEGISKILNDFQQLGLVDFVDNHKAVRVREDNPIVELLKKLSAVCELEGLKNLLEPISSRGILFGQHAEGKASSDTPFDLLVVTETPTEVSEITEKHPMPRSVLLVTKTPEAYNLIHRQDPSLSQKIEKGITVWGASW